MKLQGRHLSLLLLLALSLAMTAEEVRSLSVLPAFAQTAFIEGSSIAVAAARRLPEGTVVTIEGVVTVPSGAFKSSINDDGLALQDRTAGIYVSMKTDAGFRVGQRVRARGRLGQANGLLMLSAETASLTSAGRRSEVVKPRAVRTGRVSERMEGLLLRVEGRVTRAVVNDPPYGSRLFINDGTGELQIYVSASTKIDLSGLGPGQHVRVTGFAGQYKEHYELNPRFASDIVSR